MTTEIAYHHYLCSTWTMEAHQRPSVEACNECQNLKGDDDAGRLREINADLLAALKAATERMEAVANGIPVHNRAAGVSQAAHVAHMAGHLAQHAKIARAAIAAAEGN